MAWDFRRFNKFHVFIPLAICLQQTDWKSGNMCTSNIHGNQIKAILLEKKIPTPREKWQHVLFSGCVCWGSVLCCLLCCVCSWSILAVFDWWAQNITCPLSTGAAKSERARLQSSIIFIHELWLSYSYSSASDHSVCGRFRDSILIGMQNLWCLFKSLGSVTIHGESFWE